jgi:hypothetical protein
MHLVENAPFNQGENKVYSGVEGNLVAFACKLSFQRGHEGNVSFISNPIGRTLRKNFGCYSLWG